MSQAIGNTTLALTRAWHLVSARERVLGKLARSIALVLAGKHKPPGLHDQSQDAGDYVVVTHARHVVVTGNKEQQIVYRHHTMFPGGLKEIKYQTMMATKPEEIIRKAVSGMLPKNKLRDRRLERLKIFPDEAHPYAANIVKRYDLGDAFAASNPRSPQQ
ncbi:60S ribosomal protein L23 [Tilletiopsis washingtonensis]|uniref:60S ribosomal protein L23 n=1 Tax=Tilletiopsis washingtonensis TaxID=58919 RepID=A0A316Z1Z3_9BASI|nr:60S ribosomal protein L23 [Tilletiopsis washingtonensis]PWN95810.1 60S ribosomal protein L23 [Tilletiopsis washingtonensis]